MTVTPEAFYFGPPELPLFGWLHASAQPAGGRLGLVICNPFGFEEICAHASLRRLAQAAAEAGIPALRFDYAGTGNSAGDEFEPDRLPAWIDSVHRAIETLKRETGVERICLFGLRLGAMIATLSAIERDDVAALIAFAPVVRGRGHVRELRALAATGINGAAEAGAPLESAGFVMSAQTCEDVAAIDLRTLQRPPAAEVLIVERDDLPGCDGWNEHLGRQGVRWQCPEWPGYAAMMQDAQRARPPESAIAGMASALRTWQDVATATAAVELVLPTARAAAARLSQGGQTVREAIASVPAGTTQLFGILSSHDAGTRRADKDAARIGVLMLNAGSVHHIGPNRLWVQLAREWAARGVTTLRVDLSGIGDSPARQGAAANVVYSKHALDDISAALACLRAQIGPSGRILALGLCSGAYHAFKAAVAGQRIDVALMVNPLTFFWKEGMAVDDVELKEYDQIEMVSRYRKLLFDPATWHRLVRGELDLGLIARAVFARAGNMVRHRIREVGRLAGVRLHDDLVSELATAVGNGKQLQFVFASHHPGLHLLSQLGGRTLDRLAGERKLSIAQIPGADHTFTRLGPRSRLKALLVSFVVSSGVAETLVADSAESPSLTQTPAVQIAERVRRAPRAASGQIPEA